MALEVTKQKSEELEEMEIFSQFRDATEMSISDAIRLGSSNTEKAVGWGDGHEMCALHAAQSAYIAYT